MNTIGGRILVTGGAGFIGGHLVDRLLEQGECEVTVFDNLSTGVNFVKDHAEASRIRFIQDDLLNRPAVIQAVRGSEWIFHLGGNTNIPAGIKNPDLDVQNAVIATHNVLEAMRLEGVKRLVFTSSGAVYGKATQQPTPETYGPLMPLSLYGAGKLACEAFIAAYCNMFGLRARIFRLGNALGSRMTHSAIFDFVKKLSINPKELEILGDGTSEKNYFLIEECLDGIWHILTEAFSENDPACDIINLGTDSSASVMSIARTLVEEMNLTGVRYSFTGGQEGWPGDQARVYLDVSKVNAMGWRARYSSKEAIRMAIRQFLGKPQGSTQQSAHSTQKQERVESGRSE